MSNDTTFKVLVLGARTGRPSKRLTLKLAGLKVASAQISYEAKGKTISYSVERINYLPTKQEVRLHTSQLQYPGQYRLELVVSGVSKDNIDNLKIDQLTSTNFSIL